MDFALDETQKAVSDLAKKIFAQRLGPEVLKKVESDDSHFLRPLWNELAAAGLLGTSIPESNGGSGHDFLSLCALLEQAGAAVAPLPIFATLVLGALSIAEFGTAEQRQRFLPGVARGEVILSAALIEPGEDDPMHSTVAALRDQSGWVLRGTKVCVPAAHLAERVLVPARTSEGNVGLFLIDPRASGVKLARQVTTTGEPLGELVMSDVRVSEGDVLGHPERGADVLAWLVPRATVALCAMELGVVDRALRMTAEYTTNRRQFDRPIATFQAVAQRAADAYIDVEAIRVATWHAAYRLTAGLPASQAVAIAKFVSCEAGHRVVYAAQHLHGGIGFDKDYPIHRYYLWSKQIELTLGSAVTHLTRLGAELARE
ncbi:MAG TPA: acyl-CoA dehydrogenase family protein [Polyangiaceae bacterium]|nr:acyl-CoA dehydrogenase family protein [Polyangiaceae bacterium]